MEELKVHIDEVVQSSALSMSDQTSSAMSSVGLAADKKEFKYSSFVLNTVGVDISHIPYFGTLVISIFIIHIYPEVNENFGLKPFVISIANSLKPLQHRISLILHVLLEMLRMVSIHLCALVI